MSVPSKRKLPVEVNFFCAVCPQVWVTLTVKCLYTRVNRK